MKIDIYTLLGMIKDGKAPKKILLNGIVFEYQGDDYLYKDEDKKEHWLFSESYTNKYIWLENFLKAEVEILETTITYKKDDKIEKLKDILRVDDLEPPYDFNLQKIWCQMIKNQNKINEIIDVLNNK